MMTMAVIASVVFIAPNMFAKAQPYMFENEEYSD
jgi:hypothetical protein